MNTKQTAHTAMPRDVFWQAQRTLSPTEAREHERLMRKWVTGRASKNEMLRCMELDRAALAKAGAA